LDSLVSQGTLSDDILQDPIFDENLVRSNDLDAGANEHFSAEKDQSENIDPDQKAPEEAQKSINLVNFKQRFSL
jgi:hypothetical protein